MLRTPRPASILANARLAWRGSLQLRVVTITLAASGALVLTFGLAVGGLITNGLVDAKIRAEKQVVDAGSENAHALLEQLGPGDPTLPARVEGIRANLAGGDESITIAIVADPSNTKLADPSHPDLLPHPDLPPELLASVHDLKYMQQRMYLNLSPGHQAGEKLYLVFGIELDQVYLGQVQLYYLFPLDDVVQQADLVSNTITVTGIALVLMLGLVVYFVTRMVVSPVRVAARTAQRLSNGLLDQRMEVNGEDDLAALAASFNQMAENLQRHILRLEDMSRLQRRFTSDVSHELRTPLTTVRMAADLIFNTREDLDPVVARSAELLQTELDRFEGLLAELLEISRFDAGFAALDSEPANLCPLVERSVERLCSVAERAGVEVELDLPGEPVVAEIDVRRVERILRNLIGNAIEHSEGRPILVRLAAREGAVAVTVRDHGVGLKPGEEKLVFNRFWRADPSRARQTGGTGLGLSISAEDARLHGGWLEAWGAPGQGAQFRLTVPARAGDRLVSSPLRLVPTDFRPPIDAESEPWSPKPEDEPDRGEGPHRQGPRPPLPRSAGKPVAAGHPERAARDSGAAARALRAARSRVGGRAEPTSVGDGDG
jgi:two-component system sensor histidine kinase MtrB